jgi:phosphoribosylformylglycinamidine cyclo-ligase
MSVEAPHPQRYLDAGVDIKLSDSIAADFRTRIGVGLFGGFVPVSDLKSYRAPVLVSSIDGVGTKVRLAAQLGRLEGIGTDLVHHCVNDIAVHGAWPRFFLDYLAFHHIDKRTVEIVVGGIRDACETLGIRLVGGETAEMPAIYSAGQIDVAGTVVGVVEEDEIVDGSAIQDGDVVVGFESSGCHTNGYSLIARLFDSTDYARYETGLGTTLGEALLRPHRCYLSDIRVLIDTGWVHGLAHITGGGIAGNLSRILPDGLDAKLEPLRLPALFKLIRQRGVEEEEMRRVFNMGIGLIAVCDPRIRSSLPSDHRLIGLVQASQKNGGRVTFVG